MRIWIHLALVLLSLAAACSLRPIPPESELQKKAQALVDHYYGRGHARVTVTVRRGQGQQTVSDTELGDRALVVTSQAQSESYQGQKAYQNDRKCEKLEIPRRVTVREQKEWVEVTGVAVVVDQEPGPGLTGLLEAGLGLDTARGDRVVVLQSRR